MKLIHGGKNQQQAHDGQAEILDPSPPKIDLRDAHAIRREIAAVYRDMRAGRIESQDGTRLAYVLDMMRKAFEASVTQDRIDALERSLNQRRLKP